MRALSYEKRGVASTPRGLAKHIERDVMEYFRSHLAYLQGFDEIKIYYDGGRILVTQAMHSAIEHRLDARQLFLKTHRRGTICCPKLPITYVA